MSLRVHAIHGIVSLLYLTFILFGVRDDILVKACLTLFIMDISSLYCESEAHGLMTQIVRLLATPSSFSIFV